MRKATFRLLLTLVVSAEAGSRELQRLDPHGKPGEDLRHIAVSESAARSACQTCHMFSSKLNSKLDSKMDSKPGLKPDVAERCTSCHNSAPHAGTPEHMGKTLDFAKTGLRGKVSCLSCHRAHRSPLSAEEARATQALAEAASGGSPTKPAPPTVMMRRACEDCHKW